jgi:hypothetical protein
MLVLETSRGGNTVQSGPQVGEKIPGPFLPLNVTGPDAGKKACQVCRFGPRPVALIFARAVSPEIIELLKKLDACTAANSERRLASCAVFCSNDEGLPRQLDQVAKDTNLSHIVLATFNVAGPPRYKINPEADVTVVVYRHSRVEANHVYKKGQFNATEAEKVINDLPKILTDD